ncbi:MAG: glycosyltransferase, partial [Acidobacteria bacterium]|nr:glycosyltransferase [Acidobacteriota bacterium]
MVWFWAVVAPAVALAVVSLRGERRRLEWVREVEANRGEWLPATVIVPVKGPEVGLSENLAALAALDYPDYELIVSIREPADLPEGVAPPTARLVIGGASGEGTGEKIQNLLAAIRAARPGSGVFAFADSDVRVNRGWLRSLVAALDVPGAGASTGYRWHTPTDGGFWPLLRSVWDGVVIGMFNPGGAPFAWGGSMAISRAEFERLEIARHWQGAVSDDYVLTSVVRAAGKIIAFAPGALSADSSSITARVFLAGVRRQLILTRVHRPGLWTASLVAHIVYCSAMLLCVVEAVRGYTPALVPLVVQLAIGGWKGANRRRLAEISIDGKGDWFQRFGWIYGWWTALATWVWLYALVVSAGSR